MTRSQFKNAVINDGVYMAALYASMFMIPLATVQLWLTTK